MEDRPCVCVVVGVQGLTESSAERGVEGWETRLLPGAWVAGVIPLSIRHSPHPEGLDIFAVLG